MKLLYLYKSVVGYNKMYGSCVSINTRPNRYIQMDILAVYFGRPI